MGCERPRGASDGEPCVAPEFAALPEGGAHVFGGDAGSHAGRDVAAGAEMRLVEIEHDKIGGQVLRQTTVVIAAEHRMDVAVASFRIAERSRGDRVADLERFELILTMDEDNRPNVLALATTDAQCAKVRRFVGFCREHTEDAVPDPYYGGADGFEHVLDLLEDGCRDVLETVKSMK